AAAVLTRSSFDDSHVDDPLQGASVAAEISRHDVLDCLGRDAEVAEAGEAAACQVVRFEEVDLAGGERWPGEKLEEARLELGEAERKRNEPSTLVDQAKGEADQLAQGIGVRADKLVGQ